MGLATDSKGGTIHSASNRFAVIVAEKLEAAERAAQGGPSLSGCYAALEILREMCPLLGPLEPVLQRVMQALRLCLLSTQHYSELPAGAARSESEIDHSMRRRSIGQVPYFVLVS